MTNPTEIVARAIFDAAEKQDYVSYYRFHDGDTCLDGHFNLDRIAEAAIAAYLTALSEAGYVVVPRLPTDRMWDAGHAALETHGESARASCWAYVAMIEASLSEKEDGN